MSVLSREEQSEQFTNASYKANNDVHYISNYQSSLLTSIITMLVRTFITQK